MPDISHELSTYPCVHVLMFLKIMIRIAYKCGEEKEKKQFFWVKKNLSNQQSRSYQTRITVRKFVIM